MALLLCLSLLSFAASAPVPQTNPAQPAMEFTFTTSPPAAVNAFTFTMPGDSNPSTAAPLMDNGPIEPVETPVDPNVYNGYYSTDSAATQGVQNMDDALLIQDTTMLSQDPSENIQQDDAQPTVQEIEPVQEAVQDNESVQETVQSDEDTTMGVPVLYDAPEGAVVEDSTPENIVPADQDAQPLQDLAVMNNQDSGDASTYAPMVLLDDSAVPAEEPAVADFSDLSATSGPALILNDQDPTDSNPSSDDYEGAANAVQRDAPVDPVVMDDLTPETAVQDQDAQDATVVVPVSTTVAPQNDNVEVVPLVTVQPVEAQPVDDTPADDGIMDSTVIPAQDSFDGLLLAPGPVLADHVDTAPVQEQTLTMVNVQQLGDNTAYQVINMTQSLAENLLLNISMPMDTRNLLQRLNYSTSSMDTSEKLDVALQLTGLAHNLMSQVDDRLDDLTRQ